MIEQARPSDCTSCPLSEHRKRVVPSVLLEGSRVMFIGGATGHDEETRGIPFAGPSGQLLDAILKEVGLNRSQFSISNTVSCKPVPSANGKKKHGPNNKEIKACSFYLDMEIKRVKPELIVTFGAMPLKQILPGLGSITKVHGQWFDSEVYGCKVLPVFHPDYILVNADKRSKLVADLKKVKFFLDGKDFTEQRAATSYAVVKTKTQFDWMIQQLHTNPEWAADTETNSKEWRVAEIFVFTFSWKAQTAVLLDLRSPFCKQNLDYVWDQLRKVFANKSKKVFQNGPFDIKILKKKGVRVANYYADTVLMDYLLDENRKHNLGILAELYTDCGGYERPLEQYVQQNKIENYEDIPVDILYPYAQMDADVTFRCYQAMLPKLKEESLEFVLFTVMMPMQKIFIETEYNGVSLDIKHLEKTIKKYKAEMESELSKVLSSPHVISFVKDKQAEIDKALQEKYDSKPRLQKKFLTFSAYYESLDPEKITFEFNVGSGLQKQELLITRMKLPVIKRTDKNNVCLDADVLEEYAKKNKFCAHISRYTKLGHLNSTFLEGMQKHLVNGKVHTDYFLFSTVTGRPSSRKPNLNNIPRTSTATDIKDIFCADDGDWLVESDQSQAEFRVWINYAQDPQAMYDIKMGLDIHKLFAAMAKGIVVPKRNLTWDEYKEIVKDVTKDERTITKRGVFGSMYGASAMAVAYQLDISEAQAQKIQNALFSRYSVAKKRLTEWVQEASLNGYVLSLFNRRRRLPNIHSPIQEKRADAMRQAMNSPTQALASDVVFLAAIRIIMGNLWPRRMKSRLVLTVYDSLVFNAPTDELEFVVKSSYIEMKRSPCAEINVPLDAEIKIGKNWGSLVEVDPTKPWSEEFARVKKELQIAA
jgi:DNA polymerase-1